MALFRVLRGRLGSNVVRKSVRRPQGGVTGILNEKKRIRAA